MEDQIWEWEKYKSEWLLGERLPIPDSIKASEVSQAVRFCRIFRDNPHFERSLLEKHIGSLKAGKPEEKADAYYYLFIITDDPTYFDQAHCGGCIETIPPFPPTLYMDDLSRYQEAANKGHVKSMRFVALILIRMGKDDNELKPHLHTAVDHGDRWAMSQFARRYLDPTTRLSYWKYVIKACKEIPHLRKPLIEEKLGLDLPPEFREYIAKNEN